MGQWRSGTEESARLQRDRARLRAGAVIIKSTEPHRLATLIQHSAAVCSLIALPHRLACSSVTVTCSHPLPQADTFVQLHCKCGGYRQTDGWTDGLSGVVMITLISLIAKYLMANDS